MAPDTKNTGKHSCIKELGRKGERETYAIIRGMDRIVPFTLYSNIYLRKGRRGLTEIDILLVSEKGLIAIENKEYSGTITGSFTDHDWICTYTGKKQRGNKTIQRRFRNPVRQNRMHIEQMAGKMGIGEDDFLSLIVFPDTAKISIQRETLSKTLVLHRSALPEVINRYFSENNPKFNKELIDGWNRWLTQRLV